MVRWRCFKSLCIAPSLGLLHTAGLYYYTYFSAKKNVVLSIFSPGSIYVPYSCVLCVVCNTTHQSPLVHLQRVSKKTKNMKRRKEISNNIQAHLHLYFVCVEVYSVLLHGGDTLNHYASTPFYVHTKQSRLQWAAARQKIETNLTYLLLFAPTVLLCSWSPGSFSRPTCMGHGNNWLDLSHVNIAVTKFFVPYGSARPLLLCSKHDTVLPFAPAPRV